MRQQPSYRLAAGPEVRRPEDIAWLAEALQGQGPDRDQALPGVLPAAVRGQDPDQGQGRAPLPLALLEPVAVEQALPAQARARV